MALMSNGTVLAWGIDDAGQTNVPANLTSVEAIAGAKGYCLALETNGTLAAWGAPPTPPAALSNVVAIAAGQYHSLAILSNGAVLAWGANQSGEAVVPSGLTNVIAIAAGWSYSLALSSYSTVLAPLELINPTWSGNSFSVSLQSQNGVSYTLQSSDLLSPANWTPIQSSNGTGGVLILTDSSVSGGQRFYRVQLK
jgi:alpha-tubulin suppressor-like RCC1 family protein